LLFFPEYKERLKSSYALEKTIGKKAQQEIALRKIGTKKKRPSFLRRFEYK
jgi:hypothetical protein